MSRRVLCDLPMDLLGCCLRGHNLVSGLHVDPIIELCFEEQLTFEEFVLRVSMIQVGRDGAILIQRVEITKQQHLEGNSY